jgi:hypothetical protein
VLFRFAAERLDGAEGRVRNASRNKSFRQVGGVSERDGPRGRLELVFLEKRAEEVLQYKHTTRKRENKEEQRR